ncbi:MAG: ImmA/IrrE family metallo-endopeptidase [Methanobrevibacter sp.]|jgi:Zn-dependent peptidase ImmA (M78 family)|nr:ImmA/IrrE family metallo-endopeptidase [Methanobrevibacter sp.]
MSSAKLKTNKEWLVWARKTAHYKTEDIAKIISKPPETIKEWENTGEISFNDLSKLAHEYQRPTTIFFNDDNPEKESDPPNFRTEGSQKMTITPQIAFEIRKARSRRETLLNLEDDSEDFEIPLFPFKKFQVDDNNKIPELLSDFLGYRPISGAYPKLEHWINKVESLGLLVFQFYDIEPSELRGYALYYDKLPIIGINSKEKDNAKKFTFFHELAHIIMKKEGLSNINQYSFVDEEEVLCNKIAAETLLPDKVFSGYINANDSFSKFLAKDIKTLSRHFRVSQSVIVRKALTLDYISKKEYEERINEFKSYINISKTPKSNNESEKKKRIKSDNPNHERGIHNKAIISFRKNGKYFTKFLLNAYEEEIISDIDVALELGVSIETVSEMKKILGKEKFNES